MKKHSGKSNPNLTLIKARPAYLPLLFCLWSLLSFSQDTLQRSKPRPHSPRKAMIFSACIPGLGQAYNKKYWKIPIVYAGLGTTYYFFDTNNKLYKQYKKAYVYKTDSCTATVDLYPTYTETQLRELSDAHRRYRDLNVILAAFVYTLNVVDAYVDAQLMNFDVSDNLSMSVFPQLDIAARRKKPSLGLTLSFRF